MVLTTTSIVVKLEKYSERQFKHKSELP